MVDQENGTFRFQMKEIDTGPMVIGVNGSNALVKAFLFQRNDSIVGICTVDGMDIISTLKCDATCGLLQMSLVNSGEAPAALFQMKISSVGLPSMDLSAAAIPGGPWNYTVIRQGDSLVCNLLLSDSRIVLLPGEKLTLPALKFFYHLCPR